MPANIHQKRTMELLFSIFRWQKCLTSSGCSVLYTWINETAIIPSTTMSLHFNYLTGFDGSALHFRGYWKPSDRVTNIFVISPSFYVGCCRLPLRTLYSVKNGEKNHICTDAFIIISQFTFSNELQVFVAHLLLVPWNGHSLCTPTNRT